MIPTDVQGRQLLAAERFEQLRGAPRSPRRAGSGRGALRRRAGRLLLVAGARLAGEERRPCGAQLAPARTR